MIGQKLGSFLIESELGSGAMGIVYKGIQDGKDRPAAIKIIAADQMGKGKSFERFLREATILEQFRHPNIVRYLARGKSGATYYYAMEYVAGRTLDAVLSTDDIIPWRQVVALGVQLCDALQYAHDRGIVHRDLKPSNLMVNEKGQLKLTDFGIAKDLDGTALTATGRTLGTAAYMAPEQIRGTPEVSHKTDLYALGCVFYQMLTGQPPFTGTSPVILMHAHMNQAIPRPSLKVEEIPKALDDLVVALMSKNPTDRPWDAALVGQTLRELQEKDVRKEAVAMVHAAPGTIGSMPTRAEATQSTESGPRPPRKKKGKKAERRREITKTVGLAAAGLVVAGLIAYLVWPPGASYLHAHAATLMASADPLDWIRARDEYIDPLDARFPKHAFREETEGWRDRIDVREATRRAEILEKPNLAAFSKPKTEAEALYIVSFNEADAALKLHHDVDAVGIWAHMAQQLTPAEEQPRLNRGWKLIALARADELNKAIARRRETVAGLLRKAVVPANLAASETARKYSRDTLDDLIVRFSPYPDVADLIAAARGMLDADPSASEPKAP